MKQALRVSAIVITLLSKSFNVAHAQTTGPAGLTNGLVTWLQLDETTGTKAQDVSGAGRSAQIVNTGNWHAWGKVKGAIRLQNDAAIRIPLRWQPAAFTVSWWVYADGGTIGNWTQAVGASLHGPDPWSGFLFHASSSGRVYTGTDLATRIESPDNTLQPNVWQHFVFTFNRGEAALYRNGQQVAYRASGMSMPAPWSELAVGSTTNPSLRANGYYDDVRVYDRALSPTEVTQLAASTAVIYTPPADPADDLDRNWNMSRSFDGNGNIIGEGKAFTDALGRSTQGQVKSQTTGHVLATQTVYSSGGKPALSTLVAPTNNSAFRFKKKFLTTDGQEYQATHFEGTHVNSPAPADQPATPGSVGYYYSTSNTLEPLTATTEYPFGLTEEYGGPLGGVKRVAAPGETFRMGSGRETKGREFPLLNDLDHYLTLRQQFVPGASLATTLRLKGEKAVNVNVDGKESINFSDADGKLLATCLSGSQYPGLTLTAAIHAQPENSDGLPQYQDLHIPAAGSVSLSVQGSGRLRIINLLTEAVTFHAAPWQPITLEPGFYRVISEEENQIISYLARYGEFSYSYYDDAGRVVATVAPKGVSLLTATPGSTSTNSRVGSWSFNENTGSTVADQSGKGLTGTLMNHVSWGSQLGGSGTLCGLQTEHQGNLTLTAPAGTVFTGMLTARYGTGQGSDCASYTFDPSCSADVTSRVTSLAASQLATTPTQISITASNSTLGVDPCGGQVKILRIQADYKPGGIPASPAGGGHLLFDGQDDYVRVGDIPALRMTNAFTIEAWIYPTANQSGIIVNKENEYEIARFEDGSIQWAINNTSPGWTWINTGIIAPLNTWSHIGLTYNNGVVTAYLNGSAVGTPYSGAGDVRYSAGEFWIGGRQCCSQFFKGALDEVRVWSTVRTPNVGTVTEGSVPFVTRNTYSGAGTLLATESTDEGRTEYVYARDGRIRFSQSTLQKQQNRFSYSNYDEVGRVVESGEYQMANGQGHVFENQLPKVVAYEAENASSNPGPNTNWPGYRGTGFVGDLTSQGTNVHFNVSVPTKGRYTVVIRYAADNTGVERRMPLYVNWSYKYHIDFPCTNSWANWSFQTFDVDLDAGSNSIRLQHDGRSNEGWINVDYIEIAEERTPASNSVLTLLEERMPSNSLDVNRCSQRNTVWYDLPMQDAALNSRTQEFVLGAVAKTSNGTNTTWYSYDEMGRVVWMVQTAPAVGTKMVDYTYDFLGNVLEVAYQKGQPDAFYHHYEYDADRRLRSAYTSPDGLAANRTLQARYFYYLHGPLKRVELADRLQGIDYAYTLQGWLKSINNVEQRFDPGQDSPAANGTLRDLFSMRLDYFDGDYRSRQLTAPNLNSPANQNAARYDGTVKANMWRTAASSSVHGYAYQYDAKGQLLQSDYGQLTGGNYLSYDPTHKFEEGNLSYDAHGNILSLRRRDTAGITTDDFTYQYTPNTNKLLAVKNQNGANVLSYEYDENGQMTRESEAGKGDKYLRYDVTGRVTGVYRNANFTSPVTIYNYNDRGFRSSKVVFNAQGTTLNTTYFITDAEGNVLSTYEQQPEKDLQQTEVPIYGSSRLGTLTRLEDGSLDSRYELNDQLGNARVIFHKPKTIKYQATMEPGQATKEEEQFTNIQGTRVYHPSARTGSHVSRINASQGLIYGPGKTLAVEQGDTITFSTWMLAMPTSRPDQLTMKPLLAAGAAVGSAQVQPAILPEGRRIQRHANWLNRLAAGISFTGWSKGATANRTVAMTGSGTTLRYILRDVDGTVVEDREIAILGNDGAWHQLKIGVRAAKAGTAEMIISSTLQQDVLFDDVEVTQTGCMIVQEQHTYAFGSPLTGLNYVIGNKRYRHGYQGQHTDHDEETGYEAFELRLYNSRIGRWMTIDPAGQFYSGYVGMGNNPLINIDPDGAFAGPGNPFKAIFTLGDITKQTFALGEVTVTASRHSLGALRTLASYASNVARTLKSIPKVDEPGTLESAIPVWGSGRQAIHDFQNGNYAWGAFNTAMAVSDVFLVKSLVTGVGRIGAKTAWKTGSHTWGATRKWIGKNGLAARGQEVHHWLLHRNQGIGKYAPNWLKNQPWNLMNMPNQLFHDALHGVGPNPMNLAEQLYHGTPRWFKSVIGSGGGRTVEGVVR
ncbi:LamG-like jellyroll fold domain-containing protein [Hymenobacter glacieicola]|uniref:CBM6 domain-containing protein n=1 Tax=Hymenobacter glacieicola TaxID=1562124 RepID=A0ABQ1X4H4_9BACT|nr:LamG-like jellyroll fold domain-containing protein [Hymenobacter glacieicola]GGG59629.1 hypothetical protein GCM10011378_39520 [Hymenobacter glacieicola]